MEQYVALFYGHDGILGRTILCDSWDQAVQCCIKLAEENGEKMTDEQKAQLSSDGDCRFEFGNAVHIGGLETPDVLDDEDEEHD